SGTSFVCSTYPCTLSLLRPLCSPPFPYTTLFRSAIMAVIVLLASAWAVRRLSAPLRALASASERLGKDVSAPGLPEIGTVEMQRSEEHTSELQSHLNLVCRLLLEKKNT